MKINYPLMHTPIRFSSLGIPFSRLLAVLLVLTGCQALIDHRDQPQPQISPFARGLVAPWV